MITRVDNIDYCKLNELEEHLQDYDSVVLYLQCYKNINNSKDIYTLLFNFIGLSYISRNSHSI